MGRPKGTGHGNYGPPGQCAGDREYRLHYAYCKKLGRRVSWEKYLAAVGVPGTNKANRYGPPGAKAADPKARAHRAYCYHFATEFTYAEYRQRVNARSRENRYGIPGDRTPEDAKNHKRFCKRVGRYVTWKEYRDSVEGRAQIAKVKRERKAASKREPAGSVFSRPIELILAKFKALGLAA